MREREPSREQTTITRRELFRKGVRISTAAAALYGLDRLGNGVRFSDDKILIHPLDVHPADSTLVSLSVEEEQPKLERAVLSDTPQKLFTLLGSEVFGNNPEILVAHRAGNRIETIKKAYQKGVQVFDIDANDVGGTVYGEHGLVPSIKLGKFELRAPLVIDVDEKAFKLGKPKYTFEELVSYVGLLSSEDRPCGVSIELKRGEFKEKTINKMFDILESYNIPAIMKFRSPEKFETALTLKALRNNETIFLGTGKQSV